MDGAPVPGMDITTPVGLGDVLMAETWSNGTIYARAIGLFVTQTGDGPELFLEDVDSNSTKIVLELSWTSPGDLQDLDLALIHPYEKCHSNFQPLFGPACGGGSFWGPIDGNGWFVNRNGSLGAPDSTARLEVTADQIADHLDCSGMMFPEFCVWTAWATWKHPVEADIEFSLHVQHYRT